MLKKKAIQRVNNVTYTNIFYLFYHVMFKLHYIKYYSLLDYDAQFKSLTEELLEKTNALKAADMNLKTVLSAPTTESAKAQIDELLKQMEVLQTKLRVLSTSSNVISAEEKKTIMNEHGKLLKEYRYKIYHTD